jgi:hypothetical protein
VFFSVILLDPELSFCFSRASSARSSVPWSDRRFPKFFLVAALICAGCEGEFCSSPRCHLPPPNLSLLRILSLILSSAVHCSFFLRTFFPAPGPRPGLFPALWVQSAVTHRFEEIYFSCSCLPAASDLTKYLFFCLGFVVLSPLLILLSRGLNQAVVSLSSINQVLVFLLLFLSVQSWKSRGQLLRRPSAHFICCVISVEGKLLCIL